MKKTLIFIALITFIINAKAQITLEHYYPSASTFTYGLNQLMIIKFEVSGERYVRINRTGNTIDIYYMNHTLERTISLATFPVSISDGRPGDILYLSEQLFDTDPDIDFMYCVSLGGNIYYTNIYNEDCTMIFSDTASVPIRNNIPLQQYPIYNTSYGTKMILSYTNGLAGVFNLPGTLSAGIAEANGQLMQMQNGQLSNLYPNPSNGSVTLQYELPKEERQGELILYNMQGAEVKRYKVDNTFKDILLDNTALPAGTYFYQLQTKKGAVGTKKMVVIK